MRRREPFDEYGHPLHECWWCSGEGLDEEARACVACRGRASVTADRIAALAGQAHYPDLFPGDAPLPFADVGSER